jgi:hypothetical protein
MKSPFAKVRGSEKIQRQKDFLVIKTEMKKALITKGLV